MSKFKIRKVESTHDYDMFQPLPGNREIRAGHVKSLKKAIGDNPDLNEVRPIMVNEKFQVIDGQHRLEALRELGLPVPYQMVEGMNLSHTQKLNAHQRNWTQLDYAKSYAPTNKHYANYVEARESYPEFGHHTVAGFLKGYAGHDKAASFREGMFEVDDLERGYKWLEQGHDVAGLVPEFGFSTRFQAALTHLFRHEKYDHARLVEKMRKQGFMLSSRGAVKDYLRDLEELYNFHVPEDNRLRFF